MNFVGRVEHTARFIRPALPIATDQDLTTLLGAGGDQL